MFYSGIADEAGRDLEMQIRAHQELGWDHIELRMVGESQFTDVSDQQFDQIVAALDAADLKVSCFASAIANWATKITEPLENALTTLDRAIPRMHRLGTPFIRVMGWPNDGLSDDEWRAEAVSRMKELAKRAADGGVTLVLENCDGWPSTSPEAIGEFFGLVDSPALKAVYDTGNPAGHNHDTWQCYQAAKPHIVYVHIKAHTGPQPDGSAGDHVYPDEPSRSKVLETLVDLFAGGYDGGISIEPHLKTVIDKDKRISDAEAAYQTYVEYGRRTMKLVEQAKSDAQAG